MSQNSNTAHFPAEFGIIAGLVIGWSGQFPNAILALIAWFILRRMRPATPSEVLFVSAIIFGGVPLPLIATFAGYALPSVAIELLAVLAIAVLLYITHARVWACVLLIHTCYVAFMRSFDFYRGASDQKVVIGAIVVKLIIAWQ